MTLAHRDLGVDPAASCRRRFVVYTSDDVTRALDALALVLERVRRR